MAILSIELKNNANNVKKTFTQIMRSIWLFPILLTIILIILTAFRVHGSSIGIYHQIFYGQAPDNALLLNRPQPIRSDEWLVISQKIIAQSNDNFKEINSNQGDGENLSIVGDAPYRGWSALFKPHNFGFYLLPFENAFAFRWWSMAYMLILSAYFFVLSLLPGKKLLASILALTLFFSPFLHWWYLYGTLGSIFYSLFGITVVINLLRARSKSSVLLWSLLLCYIAICFILILYPPFQIPCALVAAAFCLGFVLDNKNDLGNLAKIKIVVFISSVSLALLVCAFFFAQRIDIVDIVQNTSYPGARTVNSGNYSFIHFISSETGALLQSISHGIYYLRPEIGVMNRSEASNFILVFPFLLPLIFWALARRQHIKDSVPYEILITLVSGFLLIAWLFIPHLTLIGKATLLNVVPQTRSLIGIGLFNFIFLILFIKHYGSIKQKFSIQASTIYTLITFITLLLINFYVLVSLPGFIHYKEAVLLALPLSMFIYLIMRKQFVFAAVIIMLFSFLSIYKVNPVYVGTDIISKTPISDAIKKISSQSNKKWVTDNFYIENFSVMNGAPSIGGTYMYPQLKVWDAFKHKDEKFIYNRYAHVNFVFDRDPTKVVSKNITLVGMDQFTVTTEPCDKMMKAKDVGYIITTSEFENGAANCAHLERTVSYPAVKYYIYKLSF